MQRETKESWYNYIYIGPIDFKIKTLIKDKEEDYMLIEGSIQHVGIKQHATEQQMDQQKINK